MASIDRLLSSFTDPTAGGRTDEPKVFAVEIEAIDGWPPAMRRAYERALEHYAELRDVEISGSPWHFTVQAHDRITTVVDQVVLLHCLSDLPGLRRIRLGELHGPGSGHRAYLEARQGNPAYLAVTTLFRMGRVGAEQYLQLLGGFVRTDVH